MPVSVVVKYMSGSRYFVTKGPYISSGPNNLWFGGICLWNSHVNVHVIKVRDEDPDFKIRSGHVGRKLISIADKGYAPNCEDGYPAAPLILISPLANQWTGDPTFQSMFMPTLSKI